jgi:hypothetical protein
MYLPKMKKYDMGFSSALGQILSYMRNYEMSN